MRLSDRRRAFTHLEAATATLSMSGVNVLAQCHHMKQLLDAGLVTREQRGKWAYFRLADEALRSLAPAARPLLMPVNG